METATDTASKKSLVGKGQAKAAKAKKRKTAKQSQSALFDKELAGAAHKEISDAAHALADANEQFSEWSRDVQRRKEQLAELLRKHKVRKKYRVGDLVAVPKVTPEKFDAKVEDYKE